MTKFSSSGLFIGQAKSGVKVRRFPGFGLLFGLDGGCAAGELLSEFESLAGCIGKSDHRIVPRTVKPLRPSDFIKGGESLSAYESKPTARKNGRTTN